MIKKAFVLFIVLILLACILVPGCAQDSSISETILSDCPVEHETEFGGIYINKTIDEFNSLGFEYGDSVDVTIGTHKLEDIPYYNGYYTANEEPLLVAYPGYPYIKVCINNGGDLWDIAGISDDSLADIRLREKGKYLDVQSARDIHYVDDVTKFPSDVVFANFRSVSAGDIRNGKLFRSASPCDNQHKRAPYVDDLAALSGVNFVLDLADTREKIEGYIKKSDFDSPYFLELYESGRVLPISLNMNYTSQLFMSKLADGLTLLSESDGPYLIHCTEGKDRTGFVIMLIEALCGAGYDEIRDDYMITYNNYYGINKNQQRDKYDVIVDKVLDPMLRAITDCGDADLKTVDLRAGAEDYLKRAGLDDEEIERIRKCFTTDKSFLGQLL